MKGIILAGGLGTRLHPLTKVTNKHLLPVFNKPMILHVIGYMYEARITDIMIVTGRECCGDFLNLLGSGREFGVDITYKVQEDADGIAGALMLCEAFASKKSVCVMLGDNLLENGLTPLVASFTGGPTHLGGAMIFGKQVEDPERFGVATLAHKPAFNGHAMVTDLIEKPKDPESNWAVIGVYCYDSQVWDILPTLEKSARGEYEITDVNRAYLDAGRLYFKAVEGWWHDAGTIESLFDATVLMHNKE